MEILFPVYVPGVGSVEVGIFAASMQIVAYY